MSKVVVGMSGGVDSSVAAYLLKEQGHEVIGLFMKNWHDTSVTISDECPWIDDSNDAMLVSEHLGIPFQTIDLSEEYKKRIVDYMFAEYERGRTPNPDILCNREIKFDVFLKAALKLGADYVATGHYCRKKETINDNGDSIYHLLAGIDNNKDQSYFLSQISQQQLKYALFPIGELTKPQVREIANKINLPTANKKDSQGLCFIGKVRLPEFLQQQLKPKKGNIYLIENKEIENDLRSNDLELLCNKIKFKPTDGKKIAEHQGAHYYTIGQRKGLDIGGTPLPLYVIDTNTTDNAIYVGMGENHYALARHGVKILSEDIHWLREDLRLLPGQSAQYLVRIRYRQALINAVLEMKENTLFIVFETPINAIASGQFATWYLEDELIGSGVID